MWPMSAPQGMSLDHLALEARSACVLGYHGTVIIQETVLGQLPLQRHRADSRLKHPPSLCERSLFACPGALASGVGLLFIKSFPVSLFRDDL